jgi:hypothetical protein
MSQLDFIQRSLDSALPTDLLSRTHGEVDYDALLGAMLADKARYLDGLSSLYFMPQDLDQWNAEYDYDKDEIRIQPKYWAKDYKDRVRTLLHEGGHRGHDRVDRAAFVEFNRQGLGSLENFQGTANPIHLKDLEETGCVIGGQEQEVFAESYAKFCLALPQSDALNVFWSDWLSR